MVIKILLCWCISSFLLLEGLQAFEQKIIELRESVQQAQQNFPQGDDNDPEYVKKILKYMVNNDQSIRQEIINSGLISPTFEKGEQENGLRTKFEELIKRVDEFHTFKMKQLLKKHGWITISKFGAEADHQAWLLIQHTEDIPLQTTVLFLLKYLMQKGETNKQNYAYLYDRVALKFPQLGMQQRYGTQFENTTKGLVLYPCEGSLEECDQRRQDMGLEPLNNYLKTASRFYNN